ncbi:MAG: VCBS repeat-containing protein, partial [Acidobacteria bacterium]
ATGSEPRALALADFNRDGRLDLVVANTGADTISVLLGNGDGTFHPKTDFVAGKAPHAVALTDLNGDAGIDLMVGNWRSNSVSVFLNIAPPLTGNAHQGE